MFIRLGFILYRRVYIFLFNVCKVAYVVRAKIYYNKKFEGIRKIA